MLDSEIKPLPKSLYSRAVADGVIHINLEFSGGNDEGYLDVGLIHRDGAKQMDGNLANDIEQWADDVYHYSGAGDGTPYGDTVTYNLAENKVTTEEWFMERTYCGPQTEDLVIDDE